MESWLKITHGKSENSAFQGSPEPTHPFDHRWSPRLQRFQIESVDVLVNRHSALRSDIQSRWCFCMTLPVWTLRSRLTAFPDYLINPDTSLRIIVLLSRHVQTSRVIWLVTSQCQRRDATRASSGGYTSLSGAPTLQWVARLKFCFLWFLSNFSLVLATRLYQMRCTSWRRVDFLSLNQCGKLKVRYHWPKTRRGTMQTLCKLHKSKWRWR